MSDVSVRFKRFLSTVVENMKEPVKYFVERASLQDGFEASPVAEHTCQDHDPGASRSSNVRIMSIVERTKNVFVPCE